MAGRLSEKPCVKVLVLEAGSKPPLISEVPRLSFALLGTDVDWKFKTVPQKRVATGMRSKVRVALYNVLALSITYRTIGIGNVSHS